MESKTLLVDSSYLLKRSYNGAKNSYTKVGHMGGVYGFFTMIRKLIKEHKFNKVVLVWDGENGGIYRHRLDHKYKSNRKDKSWYTKIEMTDKDIKEEIEKEKSILLQRKKIQQYAEELFFRQIEVHEIEADDLIAEYCMRNHKKEEITLYTNDKDFLQLLSLDITIYLESVHNMVEAGNFFMYFPYFYKNALTMKILCGDDSDMVEGIKGIKEKTLLNNFPELVNSAVSVKDICVKSVQINEERKAKKLKPLKAIENITKDIDRLRLNHRLMNLSEPFLNEEAKIELDQLDLPLSDEGRGGTNLYDLMMADDFLSLYSNYGDYSSYVQPFYLVISKEKDLLKNFNKNSLNS